MFGLTKLILFSHFIVISVSAGPKVSKSLDLSDATCLGPTVFFYLKELPIIRYASPLAPNKILWLNQTNTIALEYYPEENTFFYTTSRGELFSYVWNKEKDKTISEVEDDRHLLDSMKDNAKLLYNEKGWYPRSIALDEVGKKLYTADSNERSIDVFDLDGKNKARIFRSEDVIPYEIVIDPSEGLLFFYGINFLERKSELHRLNMDGSDHRVIIETIDNIPHSVLKIQESLAIDTMEKLLYYKSGSTMDMFFKSAGSNVVRVVDYTGRDRVSMAFENAALLEIKNHQLYWFDNIPTLRGLSFSDSTNHKKVFKKFMLKNDGIEFSSCDLRNRVRVNASFYSCDSVVQYPYNIEFASAFKVIDCSIPPKKLKNPCLEIDNGCEDHCLLKSSGSDKKLSFGCACRLGRKLNSDEKTCSDLQEQKVDEESAPYGYNRMGLLFRGIIGNVTNNKKDEASFLQITPLFFRKLADFKPWVAWDDALKVKYTLGKKGEDKEPKSGDSIQVVRIAGNSTVKDTQVLAYDWVSKNLYYATVRNESDGKCDLLVKSARYPDKELFLGQIDRPTSMAVHPYRGYLFVSTLNKNKTESRIIRLNTDGSDWLDFPYSGNTTIFLTLDMEEDKVYWIDGYLKNKNKNLWSSNLDGSDAKLMNISFFINPTFMTMYQGHIFLRTPLSYLYIFNKDGTEYNRVYLKYFGNKFDKMILTKLKVKKTNIQYLNQEDNPCAINNGGCETFCFAVPANDSKKLQKVCDGKLA